MAPGSGRRFRSPFQAGRLSIVGALVAGFSLMQTGATGDASAQTDIWVSQATGTNSGTTTGIETDPFKSITFALLLTANREAPGLWTVHIKAGTYDVDPAKPLVDREIFPIVMRQGMTLQGEDGAANVVISGAFSQGISSALIESDGVTGLTIKDLTLGNGAPSRDVNGGACQLTGASGLIEGCVFENNRVSSADGGGLWFSEATGAPLTLTANTFSGNSASRGGGFYVSGDLSGDVTNNTFSGNSASSGAGGGFRVASSLTGDVTNNTFSDNSATWGGGFYVASSLTGGVTANTFSGNSASSGWGGGFYVSSSLTGGVTANTFSGNSTSSRSGGGFCVNSSLTGGVTGNTFSGNSASSGWGGGFYVDSSLTGGVTANTFSGNSAGSSGGGFCANSSLTGDVTANTFSGNSATYGGGFFANGSLTGGVIANTFSGNSATNHGGGFRLNFDGGVVPLSIVSNNMFLRNSATTSGAFSTDQNVMVVNNTFLSDANAWAVRISATAAATIVQNNIFLDGTGAIVEISALELTITDNDFFNVTNILARNSLLLGNDIDIIEVFAPGFSNNHDWAPDLVGDDVVTGSWTADPVFDAASNETTLTDGTKAWAPGEFSGTFVDLGNDARFPIVANTATELIIEGNLVVTGLAGLALGYTIDDFHLMAVSQNVDAGIETSINEDFEGDPRPQGSGFDIGADEFSLEILRSLTVNVVGLGTVAVDPDASSFTSGTVVTLTATADADQIFDGWTGAVADTAATTTTITMDADQTVTAAFRALVPELTVTPADQAVSSLVGSSSFEVSNTGEGSIGWTASVLPGADWLTISSGASGTDTGTINVSFTQSGDVARVGTIRVTTVDAPNSPVDVTLTQASFVPATLAVSDDSLDVASGAGTTTFDVLNIGGGSFSWTASVTAGSSWLSLTSGGSGTDAGTVNLSFTQNTGGAVRIGTVTVSASGALDSPLDVRVRQDEDTTPELRVTPATRSVGVAAGTTSFAVTNTGNGTLSYTAAITSDSPWLSITSGESGADAGTISLSFPENTEISARSATLEVSDPNAPNSPITVMVTQAGADEPVQDGAGEGEVQEGAGDGTAEGASEGMGEGAAEGERPSDCLAPEPPTGLSADATADAVLLRWDVSDDPCVAGYNVFRGTNAVSLVLITDAPTSSTRYLDDTVEPGLRYFYAVTSVSETNEESGFGEIVEVETGVFIVSLPNVSAVPGGDARIPVNVINNSRISATALQIEMSFPAELVDRTFNGDGFENGVKVERTAVTRDFPTPTVGTSVEGQVSILSFVPEGGAAETIRGEGHLFDVLLRIRPDANDGASGPLTLSFVEISDENGDPISVSFASFDALLKVTTACLPGDINGDVNISILDAVQALLIAVNLREADDCEFQSGDVNGDGRIDSADAVLILRIAANLDLNPAQSMKSAGLAPVTLSIGDAEAAPGEGVTLSVRIDDASNFAGNDLVITFNSIFTLESVELGSGTSDFQFEENIQQELGTAFISMGRKTELTAGEAEVLNLNFLVSSTATAGTFPIGLEILKLSDQFGGDLSADRDVLALDGSIKICLPGSVVGVVIDDATDLGIAGASVSLDGGAGPVTTDSSGAYVFLGVPPGEYEVAVSAPGFGSEARTVLLICGDIVSVDITLVRAVEGEGPGDGSGDGEGKMVCAARAPGGGFSGFGTDFLLLVLACVVLGRVRRRRVSW